MNEVGQVMTKEELIEKLNQVRNLVNDRVNNLETSKLEQDINDLEAKLANDNLLVDDGRLNLLEELYNEAKTEEQNNLISLKRKDDIVNAIINDNKKLEAEISALTSVNNQMVDHLTINKEKIGDSELEHLNSMIIRNEETINRNKLSILGNNDLISRYNGFQVDLESRKDKLAFITNEHREALNNHKIELNRIQQERNNERIKNAETLKELKTKYTQNQMLKREATTINFKISDLITGLENNTVSIEQAMREVEILRAGYNKAQLNDGNLGLQRTDRYRYNPNQINNGILGIEGETQNNLISDNSGNIPLIQNTEYENNTPLIENNEEQLKKLPYNDIEDERLIEDNSKIIDNNNDTNEEDITSSNTDESNEDDKTSTNNEEEKEESKENETNAVTKVKRTNSLKEKLKKNLKKVAAAIAIAMVALTAANQAQAPLPAEPIPIESVQEDLSQDEIAQISEQLENENQKISIDDTITVTGDASIYDNQYDAHHQTNKMKPLYESNKEREVIGASVRMSDGTLKFVQDNDLLNVLMEQGGEVVSYLTGTEAEPEGFWNENDCIKVNQMNMEKGGINR